jgi:hypothetical protein
MICSTSGSWRMCAARNASRSRAASASVPRLCPGFLQQAPQLGQGKLRGVGGRGRGGKHGAGTGLQNADFTEVAVPAAAGRCPGIEGEEDAGHRHRRRVLRRRMLRSAQLACRPIQQVSGQLRRRRPGIGSPRNHV